MLYIQVIILLQILSENYVQNDFLRVAVMR